MRPQVYQYWINRTIQNVQLHERQWQIKGGKTAKSIKNNVISENIKHVDYENT